MKNINILRNSVTKKLKNTTRNKIIVLNKDMPYEIIGELITLNETSRRSYFEEYWGKRSAVYLEMETTVQSDCTKKNQNRSNADSPHPTTMTISC